MIEKTNRQPRFHYSTEDLTHALQTLGVSPGDIIFTHVDLAALGMPQLSPAIKRPTREAICENIFNCIRQYLGENGTWLVPTFSYTFGKNQIYDPLNTPSDIGMFTEWFRQQPGVIRSLDPMFSIAGIGTQAHAILENLPHDCFGEDSVFARLHRLNAKIVNLGVGVRDMTFLHYVEQKLQVPYRFKKLFFGFRVHKSTIEKEGWMYNVRPYTNNCSPAFAKLDPILRANNALKATPLGLGEVINITCQTLYEQAANEIRRDAWFLAQGPALSHQELIAAEDARTLKLDEKANDVTKINGDQNLSTQSLIDALWHLPRDIVSHGYDRALEVICAQFSPSSVILHNYPSGTECWTWIVPEKWTCHEAYLETMEGIRLFSYSDHALHVMSYSLPFDGIVSREVLFSHLHTHPTLPNAIPFRFKYYERDWGLCCSQVIKNSLKDSHYRVVIRSIFSYGNLRTAEIVAKSSYSKTHEKCFVLCAHLCHPQQINDDLTGVIVGINVMRELQKREHLRYTYRMLILPETIGSVAWLSHNETLIPHMIGGLFLEMLGCDLPHALQLAFPGNSWLDQTMTEVVNREDAQSWVGEFRKVVGNDERQFNAPGVRVPMLSLSRIHPPSHPDYPYPAYHSSDDNPSIVTAERLDRSTQLVLKIIDEIEKHVLNEEHFSPTPPLSIADPSPVPTPFYKGEVFCSRYGIHIDRIADPEGHNYLFSVMNLIDGKTSLATIANQCDISAETVSRIVHLLQKHGLVGMVH
jgi:aminopeptidase-like protein/aminoglycoside N3'-acetyltransferase